MKNLWIVSYGLGCCLGLLACQSTESKQTENQKITIEKSFVFDIQGHRGCRGLLPENSIPAFIRAVELGVTTLEMDIVISKDNQIIVSHEPFLSSMICLDSARKTISETTEKNYNLYQMTAQTIQKCDCGSTPHPRFPEQQKLDVRKPLLSAVIDTVERHIQKHNLYPIRYNIEIKSMPEGDSIYHPEPQEFSKLVYDILVEKQIENRTSIQSFDVRPLQFMRQQFPEIALVLLVEGETSNHLQALENLGFMPEVYSPYYPAVNQELIEYAQKNNFLVIPWTVNEVEDMKRLKTLGVHGIITDYPDRAIKALP